MCVYEYFRSAMTFVLLVLINIGIYEIYFTLDFTLGTVDHYHPYEKIVVLSGCNNQTTIEGEMVKYICSFEGNYAAADVYWRLRLGDRSLIVVEKDKNYTNFRMDARPSSDSSSCRFISELTIHANLSMNNAIIYCYALSNGFTSDSTCNLIVATKPTITVPLNNVRTKKGKTVNLESLVTAVTISGWTLCTWKKNNHVINSNPHKYNFTTEINPYKNSIKYLLTIYTVSKEDEANYTLIVHYNTDTLKQHDITGDFSKQTTGALQVDNKVDILLLLGIAAAVVLVAAVLFVYIICKKKSCIARNSSSVVTQEKRSPLLSSSDQNGSDSNVPECSPVPATSDHNINTEPPESEVVIGGSVHVDGDRDEDLKTDKPPNQTTARASPSASDNSTKKLLSNRPHMQAIKDHVVCKVADRALTLALEFGISEEEASDLVETGHGLIKIFLIWLEKSLRTWKELLNVLRKINKHKLADELQDKLEKKVILEEMLAVKPSMYSLRDVIQRVAPRCHGIAVEFGLEVQYRIIAADHPNDCALKCRKVFEEFLNGNNPTWKKVIDAIKEINFNWIAEDIEKKLPEILDKEEMRGASLEHEPLKVDMVVLLQLMQSEIPLSDHPNGWLVDVPVIMERISHVVQFSNNELQKINDLKLEPTNRSVNLASLIIGKGRRKIVYKKLQDFYCVNQTPLPTAMTSDACSHEASSQSTIVYNYGDHHHYHHSDHHHYHHSYHHYYHGTDGSTTPINSADVSSLGVGTQETGEAKKIENPLCHKTNEFLQLVNSESLTPHLYQNKLITKDDFERVQNQNMTSKDKVTFLYLKLVHLGEDGFKVFMYCLRNADDHAGHEELYHKLSALQ